jgi:hypothetical protein
MSDEINRHEQIVADLKQKLTKAESRREQIAEERGRIGFAVHVTGDKAARKSLDTLNLEAAALEGDVQSLTGALDVANENLAAARAAENRAADEEKARQLLDVADEFDSHIDKLAESLDALGAACSGINGLHTKAYSLGAQRPTRKQLDVMLGRVIVTSIMRAGLQQQVGVEFLAPAARKTPEVLYQYADVIRTDANARIVSEKQEAA